MANLIGNLLEKIQSEYQHLVKTNTLKTCFKNIEKASQKIIYSYDVAQLPCNEYRNRYSNILAHDHTRFKCNKIPYINANVINDKYILTQGPLLDHLSDFWTMVFESNSKIILCLTNEMERNKSKFDLYYHDDEEKKFGHFRVKVESKKVNGNIVVRNLMVKLVRYQEDGSDDEVTQDKEEILETRPIVQIHYMGWTDFKPPSDMDEFLTIFDIVDQISPASKDVPLIVHCSAGVGRSGTWCVVHQVIEYAKDLLAGRSNNLFDGLIEGPILPQLILELRKSRAGLVQSTDQLEFCYQAIIRIFQKLQIK